MPDVLQDRCPWRDTNASADEHSDLVLEDVFSRGAIRSIDPELRHLLPMSQSNLVHTHRVETVIFLSLLGTTSQSIAKSLGEVSNLSNMYRHIWIEGT